MSFLYEFELGKASYILAHELFKLKPGETFLITADTESDERVVNATARAAFAEGAKPMVLWLASPLGVAQEADPMLPGEALTALLKTVDAWVEFNNKWLLYSTPYEEAMAANKKLRHLCLVGMNVDLMIRCIGRIDYPALQAFLAGITQMSQQARHMRITTPAGTDVEFYNAPGRKVDMDVGYSDTPGSHMLGGQIGWSPDLDSVNGVIVFDGSVNPPLGLLKEPIKLHIKNGTIVRFEGGREAAEYEAWLRSFNHPQMLRLSHVCYGFNPGARLSGNVIEDERVWGCTEWGIGHIGELLIPGGAVPAPSHSDGVCLNSSVWLDGVQILDKGQVMGTELKKLAAKLGK
ncbi:MAG: aminopeptidase [Coprothermobacterota bacterium]|nr:aminopeptidase [Coprothermobacterota bacterium]